MSSTGQATGPGTIAKTIGANIRLARTTLNLTQRELAAKVGGKVDGQRISDWERGSYRPNDMSLMRVAGAVERDLAWFYTDHEELAA